jgi:hypothetical protein
MNPPGGGVEVADLMGELEQIRKRGVRWLDGDGRQDRLDSFPHIEKLALEFAGRTGPDQLPRWQTVDALLRAAIDRPEATPAHDRLLRLFGLSEELLGKSSADLAYQLRSTEKISAKTFQRRNSTSRHVLAEAIAALCEAQAEPQTPVDLGEPAEPAPAPRRRLEHPLGVAGLVLLTVSTGIGGALVMGLADDLSYLVGFLVLLAGWLAGFRVPVRIILPIAIVMTVVLLTNVIGEFWPIDPGDGLMSGFLAAIPFGYALKHILRLIRRLGGGEVFHHGLVVVLTSVFWLGLGATLLFRAGTRTPLNSSIWAGVVAVFAGAGYLAFHRSVAEHITTG